MNYRSMTAPRRCDTSWPQTVQLDDEPTAPNPSRRSRPRSWRRRFDRILDAACWVIVVVALGSLGAIAYANTIKALTGLWQ